MENKEQVHPVSMLDPAMNPGTPNEKPKGRKLGFPLHESQAALAKDSPRAKWDKKGLPPWLESYRFGPNRKPKGGRPPRVLADAVSGELIRWQ